jgi:hypothetical protein
MTVATKTQPNYTTQDAATYKAAIDGITAVHDRLGGAFAAHEQNVGSPSPDLSVRVDAGFIFSGVTLTEVAAQSVSGFTTPSSGQERIDRVVIDASTGVASRVAGTAVSGSPSAVAPAIPSGKLPCCQIRFTDTSTAVLNSMITDERIISSVGSTITLGTPVSASGISVDFTGIPATAKRIVIGFTALSSNGTSGILIQMGDSGGVEASGYSGSAIVTNGAGGGAVDTHSTGFYISGLGAAAYVFHGVVTLTLINSSSNTWLASVVGGQSDSALVIVSGGSKSLTGTLDRVRIATQNGTDTFDAGDINVTYE